MCGRYALTLAGLDEDPTFAEECAQLELELPWECYNIAPTMKTPILDSDRALKESTWGLIPHWAKEPPKRLLINARSETVASKPSFRTAYKSHRCCVPASGFFEWTGSSKARTPYFIGPEQGHFLWFAGLACDWKGPDGRVRPTFAVLTRPSESSPVAAIHDRCPVTLKPSEIPEWLSGSLDVEQILTHFPFGTPYEVSRDVNKTANDSAANMTPIAQQEDA